MQKTLNKRVVSVVAIALVVTVTVAIQSFGETDMKKDFTIFLDAPIAKEGGTVLVVPIEVPSSSASSETEAATHSVRVTAQVSVVQIFVSPGQGYNYRFRSGQEDIYPSKNIRSKRTSIGTIWDLDPDTGENVEFDPVLTHHIAAPGGAWTQSDTSRVSMAPKLANLKERFRCQEYDAALVCDLESGSVSN